MIDGPMPKWLDDGLKESEMNENKEKALKLAIELLESEWRYSTEHLQSEISRIKLLAGVIEYPAYGTPCFCWDGNSRPKYPEIWYSIGNGDFFSKKIGMTHMDGASFEHFEPIQTTREKLGVWVARNKNNDLCLYNGKPDLWPDGRVFVVSKKSPSDYMFIAQDLLPEVTFENSPKEI